MKLIPEIPLLVLPMVLLNYCLQMSNKLVNLQTFYECFHPTDDHGNLIYQNDYMETAKVEIENEPTQYKTFC